MSQKKALMACSTYWTSTFQVGCQHIARCLRDCGYQIAFISDPISPFHRFVSPSQSLHERIDIHKQMGVNDESGNVWAYVPYSWFTPYNKPLLRTDFVAQNWMKYTRPDLGKLLKERGFESVDLLYIDSAAYAGILKYVKSRRSFYRVTDNCQGFDKYSLAMKRNEVKIASSVDVTLYTAKTLLPVVNKMQPRKTLFFPNGVDFNHFQESNRSIPDEYKDISSPIVIYVGAIDEWFDFDLVNRLTQTMPDLTFVLMGPTNLAESRLVKRSNLKLIGRKPFSDVPAYLHHADVGLIPFDVKNHALLVNSVNPLKLYEYMACGLPVVATRWQEMEEINSGAILADNIEQFIGGIRRSLTLKENRVLRVSWAKRFDWSARVKELLTL